MTVGNSQQLALGKCIFSSVRNRAAKRKESITRNIRLCLNKVVGGSMKPIALMILTAAMITGCQSTIASEFYQVTTVSLQVGNNSARSTFLVKSPFSLMVNLFFLAKNVG